MGNRKSSQLETSMSNFTWEYDLPIDDFAIGAKFQGRKLWRNKYGRIERVDPFIFEAILDELGKLAAKNLSTGEIIHPFNT